MAAATKTELPLGKLDYDAVILTLSDGETYTSDLSKPYGALLTEAETTTANAGSAINLDYVLSGRTFTIRYKVANGAVTDKKVALFAYGRK